MYTHLEKSSFYCAPAHSWITIFSLSFNAKKYTSSVAWRRLPVIPALSEADAGGLHVGNLARSCLK